MNNKKVYLTGVLANQVPLWSFIIGAIGLVLTLFLMIKDFHHSIFSYLNAFIFFTALSLGALFFVIIQFLTRAGWSVLIRRIPEHLMKNIGIMVLFFIPLLFGLSELYHWTHTDAVAHDHLLQSKAPYLNVPFFVIRAFIYFGLWYWLSSAFFKFSVQQDEDNDRSLTLKLQKYATFGVLIYALSQTFAFIDWVMSLTPHWYSTMFGVYFFAISIVLVLSTIIVMVSVLRKAGFLKDMINVEHYHDLGKLLYGFNIFWAYISFSQFFLIWYANIPEETHWFHEHFAENWDWLSTTLLIGHFAVPLLLFVSRHAKRNISFNTLMAFWLILMTLIEIYWIIMPNLYHHGIHITLADVTSLVGIGGIYFGVFFKRMAKYSLYPVNDPRLEESVHFKNA